jgi:hypothetical protein
MRVNVPRAIGLYLVWLSFISGVLLLAMGDVLPLRLGFITPENAFTCLIEAELFFVLVIWPFFIPRLLVPRAPGVAPAPASPGVVVPTGVSGEGHLLVLQVCVLFVVAMPIAFLCQNLGNVGAREFFTGHLLVATAASFVAALFSLGAERQARLGPWYILGFFVASALLPFLHFLAGAFAGRSLRFLSALSPFWGASLLDEATPLVSAGLFGGAALALFLAMPFLGRAARTTGQASPA